MNMQPVSSNITQSQHNYNIARNENTNNKIRERWHSTTYSCVLALNVAEGQSRVVS